MDSGWSRESQGSGFHGEGGCGGQPVAACARDWVSILKVGEVRGLQRSGVLGCVLGEPCGGGEQAASWTAPQPA